TFFIPPEVKTMFAASAAEKKALANEWRARYETWRSQDPERARRWDVQLGRQVPPDLDRTLLAAVGNEAGATRVLSSKVIQAAAAAVPAMVGGSADLDPSTKTAIKDGGSVSRENYAGRMLHFGIREHAMGSVCTGLSLYGG